MNDIPRWCYDKRSSRASVYVLKNLPIDKWNLRGGKIQDNGSSSS